jgi:hypothetical protein
MQEVRDDKDEQDEQDEQDTPAPAPPPPVFPWRFVTPARDPRIQRPQGNRIVHPT